MSFAPDDFPLLRASARGPKTLRAIDDAITLLSTSLQAGSIRNVELNDAKGLLGSAVHDACDALKDKGFYAELRDNQPLNALFWAVNISNLHEITAARKKLGVTTVESSWVDNMRALVSECYPLTEAVNALKSKVVMGRAPRPEPVPANPDKLELTCACCQKTHAVRGGDPQGHMVHHGYERPGEGWQTASCSGINFRALEIAPDGLAWQIKAYGLLRQKAADDLLTRDEREEVPAFEYVRGKRTRVQVARDDKRWPQALASWVHEREAQIRYLDRELPVLEKQLRDWKPVPVMTPRERREQRAQAEAAAAVPSGTADANEEQDEQEATESQGPRP